MCRGSRRNDTWRCGRLQRRKPRQEGRPRISLPPRHRDTEPCLQTPGSARGCPAPGACLQAPSRRFATPDHRITATVLNSISTRKQAEK